jgi:hypothetical protein
MDFTNQKKFILLYIRINRFEAFGVNFGKKKI